MSLLPADPEALFYTAVRLMGERDAAGAEAAFRQALKLVPDFAEVHANLGLLLDQGKRWAEAEVHYRRALELSPEQMLTQLNFGTMLVRQKRFEEAEQAFRLALILAPEQPEPWSNLGVLLACQKLEAEAEQCYRTAMVLAPEYRKAPFNLAYLLLRQGRFEEGWRALEARDSSQALGRYLQCPRWEGESLRGKSLLIGFESGHGDMIQFCRYAALAKTGGARWISVLCHPGLKTLFAGLEGVDESIAFDANVPADAWDFWVPPLSLPLLFQTCLETIPARLPYLRVAPERIEQWAGRMQLAQPGLRVGLVWQGNPDFENDADRSLAGLEVLAPLGEVAGVRYFSLQLGPAAAAAANPSAPLNLMDLSAHIVDFADTAALVMNLDLVITVDTAIAHLAGALGKPCWVLLPDYKTDWRWLTGRADTPWYPGVMRLFRQQQAGDWGAVIVEVRQALQGLSHSHA